MVSAPETTPATCKQSLQVGRETTRKISLERRLRAWPAARNGDALNAAYVGKLMIEAADEIKRLQTALASEQARPKWNGKT